MTLPVYFHLDQLKHKPQFEWSFGEKMDHPETTRRAESILESLASGAGMFSLRTPDQIPRLILDRVHASSLLKLYKTAEGLPEERTWYPSVYPRQGKTHADPKTLNHAGYWCYDSGTPLNATTRMAAVWSASCAWEVARLVASEVHKEAYALCRPPGHHASRDVFGGYCYFNNAAIAAQILKEKGCRVSILDIDFHHGNGTQELFFRDPRVQFISIHGDPSRYYPYYAGFSHETGSGPGLGTNLNLPLPEGTDFFLYFKTLTEKACRAIEDFAPDALILSAGFDTFKGDPVGGFTLETPNYAPMGEVLARLKLPTIILQEGGYVAEHLGANVLTFLQGFMEGRKARIR